MKDGNYMVRLSNGHRELCEVYGGQPFGTRTLMRRADIAEFRPVEDPFAPWDAPQAERPANDPQAPAWRFVGQAYDGRGNDARIFTRLEQGHWAAEIHGVGCHQGIGRTEALAISDALSAARGDKVTHEVIHGCVIVTRWEGSECR